MAEILLGVLTEHLAFVTANGAFDNNFGSGSRRSVHVGWSHRFQATRLEALLQDEIDAAVRFKGFLRWKRQRLASFHIIGIIS
jgi:hypothetical protein